MAACYYFGADMGNGLDLNFPSHLTDKTPHSSSDLLYFTPFLPFSLLDKIILSPTPCLQKYSVSIILCEKSVSLLTHSKPLPLESKQCPLTLASVLACADSADELRLWSESEF